MATVLAAAVFGAGSFLHAPSAYADDSDGSQSDGRTVNFDGGSVLSMLLCRSQPSAGRLTVPAESRVMFVNRLGQKATLRVNGKALVEVGPDEAAPLLFHYGPVSVSMTFPCGTNVVEQFGSTLVSVTAVRPPEPPRSAALRPTVSATPSPQPAARTGRGGLSPASPGGGAGTNVAAASPAASRSRGAAAPSVTASPTTAPSSGIPLAAGISTADAWNDPGKGGNAVVVEPLVLMSGVSRDNSSGVLALIAAGCAVCVTIAVIRAIISKRTNPTYYA